MMTLISWSLHRRFNNSFVSKINAIAMHHPDIIAFQDVADSDFSKLWKASWRIGLKYFIESDLCPALGHPGYVSLRNCGELIVSRWPVESLTSGNISVPWPERILSVTVSTPASKLIIHTVSIPPTGGTEMIKVCMLEGIYKRLQEVKWKDQILCGNFSSPREETPEGQIITWAQKRRKNGEITFIKGRGHRWDQAERNILLGLDKFGMTDLLRPLSTRSPQAFSYYHSSRGEQIGMRPDHVFASRSLFPMEASYIHDVRDHGLSDHSAIKVVFDLSGQGPGQAGVSSTC